MKWRLWILIGAIAAVGTLFLFPAIPQSEAYHNFADKRALLGVPNCLDVLSNVFFLLVGAWGLRTVFRRAQFLDPRERWPYAMLFIGVTLTAFGSSWYRLNPNDATLVWDPSACSDSVTRSSGHDRIGRFKTAQRTPRKCPKSVSSAWDARRTSSTAR
jgi:hypothetical protein